MSWSKISSHPVHCLPDHLMKAIKIWLHRPNVCSKVISCASVETVDDGSHRSVVKKMLPVLSLLQPFKGLDEIHTETAGSIQDSTEVYLRELVPKKPDIYSTCNEIVILVPGSAIFIPLSDNHDVVDKEQIWYSVTCTDVPEELNLENAHPVISDGEKSGGSTCRIGLYIYKPDPLDPQATYAELQKTVEELNFDLGQSKLRTCYPTETWLEQKLVPQLLKWCLDEAKSGTDTGQRKLKLPPSLSLIAQQKYAAKYQTLKQKYGTEMMKIWTEVTDPQKYVFEDVAIATYLILLWEKEREMLASDRLQSFIDLGCGNGLLVHILNSEGHNGKGIDIRRRNIWDVYPPSTNLVEGTVDPMDGSSYDEYDWLLGNHSDELTPWMPVMAARSGYNVRYWVLPCCFYDFFTKYERSQSTLGQYGDYLNFVEGVGLTCGFDLEIDVMRIPSTKRVCHVGMKKTYPKEEHQDVLTRIDKYIEGRRTGGHFVARERIEKVRNCTKMDRNIQDDVVSLITTKLLLEQNCIDVQTNGIIKTWNRGGCVRLEDAITWIGPDMRKMMKSECGGLQTLLRNHHQIFEIRDGNVQMRDWSAVTTNKRRKSKSINNSSSRKIKQCWFYHNHPDGCPRTAEICLYLHGEDEA